MTELLEEVIALDFMECALTKASVLTGLDFTIKNPSTVDIINLHDEVTYFVPLENSDTTGFLYIGVAQDRLNNFYEKAINNIGADTERLRRNVSPEQLLIEYAKDLYNFQGEDSFEMVDDFFSNGNSTSNFIKFEDAVEQDCYYFELDNKDSGINLKFKFAFFDKPLEETEQHVPSISVVKDEVDLIGLTESEFLEKVEEDYYDYLGYFQEHMEKLKKLFLVEKNPILVHYAAFNSLSDNIVQLHIKSYEEALFFIHDSFKAFHSFDSLWLNKENQLVYTYSKKGDE